MLIELDEWEANYLLDYLDEEADQRPGSRQASLYHNFKGFSARSNPTN